MIDEKFTAGTRVIPNGRSYVGTVKGYKKQWSGEDTVIVDLDNGHTEAIEERYLREATEEDENSSAALIARNEEAQRRVDAKKEAGKQRREELAEMRKQLQVEKEKAEEEAKQQRMIDYTAEMRRENARAFGLESLRR